MPNKKPRTKLPPLPNIIDLNPNQLPAGQANELIGNTGSMQRIQQPQAPVQVQQQPAQDQISPLKAYNLMEILGLPKDYSMPDYQTDPAVVARAEQLQQALANYNPSLENLRQEQRKTMGNRYLAQALGAKPIEQAPESQLQKQALNDLYDIYTKQKTVDQGTNEALQMQALSQALGIPISDESYLYKNIINPILTSQANYNNALLRSNTQKELEQSKEEAKKDYAQFNEQLPSTSLDTALKTAQIQKIMSDISKPNAQQQKEQIAKDKLTRESKNVNEAIDYATNLVSKNKDLVGLYSPFRENIGRFGIVGGFNKQQLQKRGEIIRSIGYVKNALISQARANGQTGINTLAEIQQATSGISENSSPQELLGALHAMKEIARRNSGESTSRIKRRAF